MMPSQVRDEYQSAIQKAAYFDLPCSRIEIVGKDSRDFLNRVLTNHIKRLENKMGCYSCLCTSKGKILVDLYCYACKDYFVIDCDEGLKQKLIENLTRYIIFEDVMLKDVSKGWGGVMVIGPKSVVEINDILPLATLPDVDLSIQNIMDPPHILYITDSYWIIHKPLWGLNGYEIWVEQGGIKNLKRRLHIEELSEQTQEILRIESATPQYGLDMDEFNIPQEAQLMHALNFEKGCYVGQETIARLQNLGHVNKRLVLLRVKAEILPKPKTAIFTLDHKEAGWTTSSSYSPKYKSLISLGYIKYAFKDMKDFTINDKRAEVIIR